MPVRIVELIPLRPMPRRMGVFDYADPQHLCVVGDLVEMPLRGKPAYGIVAALKDEEPQRKLTEVTKVAQAEFLRAPDLTFFQALAEDLVQSPASVMDAALSLPPKRVSKTKTVAPLPLSLPADEAPGAREAAVRLATLPRAFIQIPDLRRTAALVAGYLDAAPGRSLTLVAPNVRDAALLASHLGRFSPALLTGEDTAHARFRAWQALQSGATRLLVGTRLASLLPITGDHAFWVVRSGHDNHRNTDKNPRYDARNAASLAAHTLGSRFLCSDVIPRPDDILAFADAFFDPFPRRTTIYADRSSERKHAVHPLLSASLIARIEETLAEEKRILCVYNRVGDAAALRCGDCRYGFSCPSCHAVRSVETTALHCRRCHTREPIPQSCPLCSGYRIDRLGFGNRAVADALRLAFPHETVSLVEKDGGAPDPSARIMLATQHWLENIFDPFDPPPLGLIALLDADAALRSPGFRGTERALQEAAAWRGAAHACRADFLLQTDEPSFFQAGLGESFLWATEEGKRRLAYSQPPAMRLIRLTCRQHPPAEARIALAAMIEEIRLAFPEVRIESPVPSEPHTFSAELSVAPDAWQKLALFLRKYDDACVIDTGSFLW